MANNFLQYKYYLLSRASAMEIFSGAKEIAARLSFTATAKIDDAVDMGAYFEFVSEEQFTAEMGDSLHSAIKIDGDADLRAKLKCSDGYDTLVVIGGVSDLTHTAKLDDGADIKFEFAHKVGVDITPTLVGQAFFPVFVLDIKILTEFAASTGGAIKVSFNVGAEDDVRLTASVADEIITAMQVAGSSKERFTARALTPCNATALLKSLLPVMAKPTAIEALNSFPAKGETKVNVEVNASLFRGTILRDIDGMTLRDMDGKKFEELGLTEIL